MKLTSGQLVENKVLGFKAIVESVQWINPSDGSGAWGLVKLVGHQTEFHSYSLNLVG